MIDTWLLLLVGFAFVLKGADLLIDGSVAIARRFRVSPLVIGLTLVAFGTSFPEFIVSLFASIYHSSDLAIGNVIGSSIFNAAFVLGLAAFLRPLEVQSSTLQKEIPLMVLASFVLFVLVNDRQFQNGGVSSVNMLSRGDGIILLFFFAIFLAYVFFLAQRQRTEEVEKDVERTVQKAPLFSLPKSLLYVVAGLLGLLLGGRWVVQSSVDIALAFGLSETLIGLTIVSIGTSLPELVTSIVAIFKKQHDISIGNIVGSNIFNIFSILGVSAVVWPLTFDDTLFVDVWVMIGIAVILVPFAWYKKELGRIRGAHLFLTYLAYFVYVVVRG